MSLSNEEREKKILWSVRSITNLASEIKEFEDDYYSDFPNPYLRLKEICNKFWACLLSSKRNSCFWLMGVDYEVEPYKNTLWSTAISAKIMDLHEQDEVEQERIKKCRAQRKKEEELEIYDAQEQFKIKNLLNMRNRTVLDIYEWLQNIQYASNRYTDKFAEQYTEINNLVAEAFGQIFNIFQEDSFTKSWLIHEIAKLLLQNTFHKKIAEADSVQILINSNHYHHDIKNALEESCLSELKQILKCLTLDNSEKNRLIVLLDLIGDKMAQYKKKLDESLSLCVSLKITKKFALQYLQKEEKTESKYTKQFREEKKEAREELLGIKNY